MPSRPSAFMFVALIALAGAAGAAGQAAPPAAAAAQERGPQAVPAEAIQAAIDALAMAAPR